MLIRRGLGWMTGFPDGAGQWVSIPSGKPRTKTEVGRTELRRATYTLNKLRREFPRALPRVVGDVDHWANLHRSLLEILNRTSPRSLSLRWEFTATTETPQSRQEERRCRAVAKYEA